MNAKRLPVCGATILAVFLCVGSAAANYSKATHWLSIPPTIEAVDVFYLYPTSWTCDDNTKPKICRIDEPSMLQKAPAAFERQATAFQTVANVYAPFYRQNNDSSVRRWKVIEGIPTKDATAAFKYYIKHFNGGRPFILAGHSQGATVLTNLLANYMKKNPDVYERMIAAYVIGSPITAEYLKNNPHLKFAEGPDDVGVIISYNTEAPEIGGTNPVLYGMTNILAINPLTWTRTEAYAGNEYNLGSILLNPDMPLTPAADAQVDLQKGVLICSNEGDNEDVVTTGLPKGVYHSYDFLFYFYNIRANAANRIKNYFALHPEKAPHDSETAPSQD